MGLEDPFSTTYAGSFKSGQSLGEGINSASGSVADVMKQKNAVAQQAKQRQQGFDMLKTLGLVKQNDPTNDDLAKGLKDYGTKAGVSVNVNHGDNPDVERKNMIGIYKALGLPVPKGTIDVTPGTSIDAGGGMSYTTQKPVSPETQAIKELSIQEKEQNMDVQKERLQDQEESRNSTIATNLNKQVNPVNASRGSQLGKIGETTVRAKRALDLLNDKSFKIDSQVLDGISSDISGILQGGAPSVVGMSEQQYNTFQKTLAQGSQYLTAHPGDALPPDMRSYITDTLNRINSTGKYYIKNNFKTVSDLQKPWVTKNKDIWDSTKQDIYDTYGLDDSDNGASSTLKAAGMGSQQSKYTLVQ